MEDKKKIYIAGNPLNENDDIPLRLKADLEKLFPDIVFEHLDPNDNFKPSGKSIFIIDTIINISRVIVWSDIDRLEDSPNYSMHDLDLGLTLKLYKKLGTIEEAVIFGVPPNSDKQTVLTQLKKEIETHAKKND